MAVGCCTWWFGFCSLAHAAPPALWKRPLGAFPGLMVCQGGVERPGVWNARESWEVKHRHSKEEAGGSSRWVSMESSSELSADWGRLWSAVVQGDQVQTSHLPSPPTELCYASFVRGRCCTGRRPRNHSNSLTITHIIFIYSFILIQTYLSCVFFLWLWPLSFFISSGDVYETYQGVFCCFFSALRCALLEFGQSEIQSTQFYFCWRVQRGCLQCL